MDPTELDRLRRSSGIKLKADGTFTYGVGLVENVRVQRLFHAGVDVREDGQVILQVGRMWCYLETEGVARFAERAEVRGGEVWLTLCGREGAIGPARVGYAPDDRFYAWVPGVRGPIALLRDAHQAVSGALAAGVMLGPGTAGDGQGELLTLAAIPSATTSMEAAERLATRTVAT